MTHGSGGVAPTPTASVLCDVHELTGLPVAASGALWKLAESGRQLDANLVHLPAGRSVDAHAEPDLDVLLLVIAGDGTLVTPDGPEALTQGRLVWLPRGSTRGLTAHGEGLSYLTVHPRRPGLQIRSRP
ncbi:quercetin dioxygenase-like cupin family protein [Streptomyces aurantiacus]|nr:quercetin dioxygenase-like cupin family protein [Streptomyces aurantiacus]